MNEAIRGLSGGRKEFWLRHPLARWSKHPAEGVKECKGLGPLTNLIIPDSVKRSSVGSPLANGGVRSGGLAERPTEVNGLLRGNAGKCSSWGNYRPLSFQCHQLDKSFEVSSLSLPGRAGYKDYIAKLFLGTNYEWRQNVSF